MPSSDGSGGPGARAGESGLVLIEVLVALVIFAAVVLAWANATDSAIAGAVRANQERTLRMLAARKLAEIRAKPADYEEDDEGGFEEEVEYGAENPFEDYRWQVVTARVVAAGYTEDEDTAFLFPADEDAGPPKAAEGQKPADPEVRLRVVLTVSYIPAGEEEGEEFRVETFLPAPKDEEESAR